MERLYEGSRFHICGAFGTTADVHTLAGVNQGDITSPLLWNLIINALLRYVHGARQGYRHESGTMTSMLCYINDAVLLSDSAQGFRNMVYRMNRFYKWAGLRVNNAKCAIFAHDFASGQKLCTQHVRVNDKPLPTLPLHGSYRYLGVEFSLGGSWALEKARVR